MNFMTLIMLVTVVLLGLLLLVVLVTTRNKTGVLNVEEFQVEWLKIMNSLDNKRVETFELAIINADKLLDKALRDLGVPGITMGERLKSAKTKFAKPANVWRAHILRNKIAHESDHNLKIVPARRALTIYRRALKELGAI
jgi:predicted transcriptional regulator